MDYISEGGYSLSLLAKDNLYLLGWGNQVTEKVKNGHFKTKTTD